jgi:hypothetical protein
MTNEQANLELLSLLPYVNSGAVWHPLGSWVTAKATPGGAVTLSNNYHLDLGNINARIQRVQRGWSWLNAAEQTTVTAELATANSFLPPVATLDYWNLYVACQHVENAEAILRDAIERFFR